MQPLAAWKTIVDEKRPGAGRVDLNGQAAHGVGTPVPDKVLRLRDRQPQHARLREALAVRLALLAPQDRRTGRVGCDGGWAVGSVEHSVASQAGSVNN